MSISTSHTYTKNHPALQVSWLFGTMAYNTCMVRPGYQKSHSGACIFNLPGHAIYTKFSVYMSISTSHPCTANHPALQVSWLFGTMASNTCMVRPGYQKSHSGACSFNLP